jgi:hypothetical protein
LKTGSVARLLNQGEYGRAIANYTEAIRLDPQLEKSKAYVMPLPEGGRLHCPLLFILDCYATADTLALSFQRKTLLTLRGLLTLSLLAAILFQLYGHLEGKPWDWRWAIWAGSGRPMPGICGRNRPIMRVNI